MVKNIATRDYRNKEVTDMIIQLCQINMDWVLKDTHIKHIFNYIEKGHDYITAIDMPKYSAELEINLRNVEGAKNFIILKRKRFSSNDEYADKINFENFKSLQNIMSNEDKSNSSKLLEDVVDELDDNDLNELIKDMKDDDISKIIKDLEE